MITVSEFLMGRIKEEDLTEEYHNNMVSLLDKVNKLLEKFGQKRRCTSGFRTSKDQDRINPKAPKSKHQICAAIDLEDADRKLKKFCTKEILEEFDLYMEFGGSTPSWCHLQNLPPRSKNRIFYP